MKRGGPHIKAFCITPDLSKHEFRTLCDGRALPGKNIGGLVRVAMPSRHLVKSLLLLLFTSLVCVPVFAAPAPLDAFEQNRRLGRGVNIIGYDPIWRSRDQARFQEKHFRLLKEAGFQSRAHQPASVPPHGRSERLGVAPGVAGDARLGGDQGHRPRACRSSSTSTSSTPWAMTRKRTRSSSWPSGNSSPRIAGTRPDSVVFEILNEPKRS